MIQDALSPFPRNEPAKPGPKTPRAGRAALIVFLVLWAVWSGFLGWTRLTHPGIDHGDTTTDSNILNAGENFDREGFFTSWGVPALDTARAEGKRPDHYLTYPPGCYWLHQGLKAVGVRELAHFRLVSVFWSSLAALLFFVLLARGSGAVLPAAIGAAAYMLARPFVEYADNLHYLSFSQVTLFATLLAWIGIEQAQTPRSRMRCLLLGAAMFTLDSLVTFEHTLFIAVFGLARIVMTRRWGLIVPLMFLGLVPVGVLCARFAINAVAIGSAGEVLALMKAKLMQRTGATGTTSWVEIGRELLDRLGWAPVRSGAESINSDVRVGVLARPFLLPAIVLGVMALSTWHLDGLRPARRAAGHGFALLLGGASWYVVMREHADVHAYTILLLLPGLAAAIGTLVTVGWWQRALQPKGAPVRTAGLVAGCILLAAHIAQLRHAPALNIDFKLDTQVHALNAQRAARVDQLEAARPAFAGIDRLYMYTHDAPLSRHLRVPFDNDTGTVHSPLAQSEAQVIWAEPWAAKAIVEAARLLGPPRAAAAPADHLVFYFSNRENLGALDIPMHQAARLTRAWAEASLDGEAFVFGASCELAKPADAATTRLRARIVNPRGNVIARPQAVRTFASGSRVVGWAQLDRATIPPDSRIELWFTVEAHGRLRLQPAGAALPGSVTIPGDGRAISLPAPEAVPTPATSEATPDTSTERTTTGD